MTWRGRHIYLVGLPGAGKSTIGKSLSKLLTRSGYRFIDLDTEIEQITGESIAEIFDGPGGEQRFRELETAVLLNVSRDAFDQKPCVVATGGGIVSRSVNRAVMRGSGVIVWIDVSARFAAQNVLKSVLEGHARPLLRASSLDDLTEKIRTLLESRKHYYEQATLHFVTRSPRGDERTPEELGEELLKALEQMSRHVRLRPKFQTIVAPSALGDYPVCVGSGVAITEIANAIKDMKATHVVFITDDNVARLHSGRIHSKLRQEFEDRISVHQISIPAGEQTKSRETLFEVLDYLHNLDLSRKSSLVITLGGGVVSDLGGLAASIFKRGIPLVHVPTTLLGQVDAALGGKTGIDYSGDKNVIGTFFPPKLVLVDPTFLKTLEKRDLHAGLAEVFKYGLIGNKALWLELSKAVRRLTRGVDATYEPLVRTAIQEKLRYVARDEFERHEGIRELLNFGHTFGHALEAATGFSTFLHGEAVALGMRAAAWLSMELKLIDETTWREIEVTLGRIPIAASITVDTNSILTGMLRDKKQHGEGLRLILLSGIGEASVRNGVRLEDARKAIDFMRTLA